MEWGWPIMEEGRMVGFRTQLKSIGAGVDVADGTGYYWCYELRLLRLERGCG